MDVVVTAGFFAGISVFLAGAYLDAVKRGRFSLARSTVEQVRAEASDRASATLGAAIALFGPLVLTAFPEDVRLKVKKRLVQAGLDGMEAEDFLALKFVGFICAAVIVGFFALLAGSSLVWGLLAAGPGYVLPELWLDKKIKKRMVEIENAAPEFAVLMAAILSAGGVGVNEALREVANRLGGELGKEVNRTFSEIASGARRSSAMDAMAERCGVAEVNEVVRCIRTAERFGVPIAEALKNLATRVYYLRKTRAEEKLGKAQVAVIFPMLFFFIMPLLAVLFYPAVQKLASVLNV